MSAQEQATQADWQRGIDEDLVRNLAMPLMQLVRGVGLGGQPLP